jgi:hypothetical protein
MTLFNAIFEHWTGIIGQDLIIAIFALILVLIWVNIFIDNWV